MDALVVPGLQVSPRALPARQRLSCPAKITAQALEGAAWGELLSKHRGCPWDWMASQALSVVDALNTHEVCT